MTPTLDEQIAWAENVVTLAVTQDDWLTRQAILATLREVKAREAQQPVAYYVVRHRPGKSDHGHKIGPFHSLSDAEIWVNGDHVLQPLYTAPVAPKGWISVKDRLPDTDGMMVAVHAPEAALCDVWPAKWDADNKSFSADNGWFETDEVTHWMPLPAAPKEPK